MGLKFGKSNKEIILVQEGRVNIKMSHYWYWKIKNKSIDSILLISPTLVPVNTVVYSGF